MESALLEAARNQLRTVCGFLPAECMVEPDEMAPSIAGGTRFVAVVPNGWRLGDTANSSGTARDRIYSFKVVLIMRVTHISRDRVNDNLFLKANTGMGALLESIEAALDWSYATMNAANAIITTAGGANAARGFIEPPREVAIDPVPRWVSGSVFAAKAGEQPAAMARSITFDGARRIVLR